MKNLRAYFPIIVLFLVPTIVFSQQFVNSPTFKNYWYAGEAELSSYKLSQARYGELHEGTAVMVFVTEHFSKKDLVKTDQPSSSDPSVLKLNFTKKFNTGIYPYSMMTSTFLPVNKPKHSLKITMSSQDWCGHSFFSLENRNDYKININSYFEGESNDNLVFKKHYLEDDFWSIIRINPKKLPTGKLDVIPSFFFLRLAHIEVKPYAAEASIEKAGDKTIYTITYPEVDRVFKIEFESAFPHKILSWEDEYYSGWGEDRKKLKTTAKLMKTIKSDYWNKHKNQHSELRNELGL